MAQLIFLNVHSFKKCKLKPQRHHFPPVRLAKPKKLCNIWKALTHQWLTTGITSSKESNSAMSLFHTFFTTQEAHFWELILQLHIKNNPHTPFIATVVVINNQIIASSKRASLNRLWYIHPCNPKQEWGSSFSGYELFKVV